ncbi:MAG: S41 family peptidase [Chitinophagales bacterium]
MPRLLVILFLFAPIIAKAQLSQTESNKIQSFFNYVDRFYVEDIADSALVEKAIRAFLKELDPHSSYTAAKDVQAMNEPLIGNFEGIGVRFNLLQDTIFIVETIFGGPSEAVGILPGDKIIRVDGDTIAGIGINNRGVIDLLRGPKGTKVVVDIKRGKSNALLPFTITRDKIPLNSVEAAYMMDEKTGYIKLVKFSATTSEEVENALEKLDKEGMKNLVLDLQNNSGGYLNAAVDVVDQFFGDGLLVTYTEGDQSRRKEYTTTKEGRFKKGNLVVLVNQYSASASEILSGAIQDHDRGLVIGRRTFGKGLVQRGYNLPDGSLIRLTVARYFTPSGRFIQRPYEDGVEVYREEIERRMDSGELTDSAFALEFPDSLKYETTGGRTVYGGGGIMPDVWVALDTSGGSKALGQIRREGLFQEFIYSYIDSKREDVLYKYPDIDTYLTNFNEEDVMFTDFIDYCYTEIDSLDSEGMSVSMEWIHLQFKAILARSLFSPDAYFKVYNKSDDILQRALELVVDKASIKAYLRTE